MENKIANLKNIEIEVNSKRFLIFERFPDLVPFVGDEYGCSKYKKILLIWESYYDKDGKEDIIKCPNSWYFEAKVDKIKEILGNKTNDYKRWLNFARKMHEKGEDRKSLTFKNIEKILNTFSGDENSFRYCAGYNYYLRPASNSSSIIADKLDEEIAAKTLEKIIDILKPDVVVFLSKKANTSFKTYKTKFPTIKFKSFVHPASAWWNKKSGKDPKKSGKERFEKFITEKWHQ
jgi:hypothetical protein